MVAAMGDAGRPALTSAGGKLLSTIDAGLYCSSWAPHYLPESTQSRTGLRLPARNRVLVGGDERAKPRLKPHLSARRRRTAQKCRAK